MNNIGAFKNKVPLIDVIRKYKTPLYCIALVHQLGEIKYPSYSWYNNPTKSDSTVENNINAMLRHFSAHRIGQTIDPESKLPHVLHLACRAGMMITTLYREMSKEFRNPGEMHKPEYVADDNIGAYITGEEIYSLSKNIDDVGHTPEVLEPTINSLLFDYALHTWTSEGDEWFELKNNFDILFRCILKYVDYYCSHGLIKWIYENKDQYPEKVVKTIDVLGEQYGYHRRSE